MKYNYLKAKLHNPQYGNKQPKYIQSLTQLIWLAPVNEVFAFTLPVNEAPVNKISPSGIQVAQPDVTLGSALHIGCSSSPLTHMKRALESKSLSGS